MVERAFFTLYIRNVHIVKWVEKHSIYRVWLLFNHPKLGSPILGTPPNILIYTFYAIHTYSKDLYTYMQTHIHKHIYAYVYICICIYIHIYVLICLCTFPFPVLLYLFISVFFLAHKPKIFWPQLLTWPPLYKPMASLGNCRPPEVQWGQEGLLGPFLGVGNEWSMRKKHG